MVLAPRRMPPAGQAAVVALHLVARQAASQAPPRRIPGETLQAACLTTTTVCSPTTVGRRFLLFIAVTSCTQRRHVAAGPRDSFLPIQIILMPVRRRQSIKKMADDTGGQPVTEAYLLGTMANMSIRHKVGIRVLSDDEPDDLRHRRLLRNHSRALAPENARMMLLVKHALALI